MREHLQPEDLALLRVEGEPIHVSRRQELPGHFAWRNELLRLRRAIVRLLFENHGRAGEPDPHWHGAALRSLQPVLKRIDRRRRRQGRRRDGSGLIGQRRHRDFDGELFQRLAVGGETLRGFSAGEVAAVEREVRLRSRQSRWRHHEINVRSARQREPVKIILTAAILEVGQLHQVGAIRGRGKVDEAAGAGALEFASIGRDQHQHRVHARIDRFSEAFEKEALALLRLNPEPRNNVGRSAPVDRGIHRQIRRAGCRGVRRGRDELRTKPHDE